MIKAVACVLIGLSVLSIRPASAACSTRNITADAVEARWRDLVGAENRLEAPARAGPSAGAPAVTAVSPRLLAAQTLGRSVNAGLLLKGYLSLYAAIDSTPERMRIDAFMGPYADYLGKVADRSAALLAKLVAARADAPELQPALDAVRAWGALFDCRR